VPITPFQLTSGRYPGAGEIVLEYGDQDLQPVSIGDTVTVDTSQTTTSLRVVGFARTQGLPSPAGSGTARGYMSEAAIHQAFGSLGAAPNSQEPQVQDEMAFKVQQISQVNATADALAQTLQAKGVTVLYVNINQPFNQRQINVVNGVFTLLLMLSILAVMLSALLILNTVITLIAEQTPIIGMLKAVGGTRSAIVRGYLVSVGMYSTLGTLPALALGLLLV
jgi:putative ABC transport system permease protein